MTPELIERHFRRLLTVAETETFEIVERIAGGLNSDSYLVTAASKSYVFRSAFPHADGLVGLSGQHVLLAQLAAVGIAPRPVVVDDEAGVLITEYYDARPMTPAETRLPANIDRLAILLRQLHAEPADIAAYDPCCYAEAYLTANGGFARLERAEQALAAEMRQLAAGYTAHFGAKTLCHNDLVAANILAGGAGLKLIDFEFAVLATPLLDLASLVAMNQFGPQVQARLVAAYYKDQQQPFSQTEFAKVQRLVNLLAHFWARGVAGSAAEAEVARYIDPKAIRQD